jgi:hypothetical protein
MQFIKRISKITQSPMFSIESASAQSGVLHSSRTLRRVGFHERRESVLSPSNFCIVTALRLICSPMIYTLLLCALLFQGDLQTAPKPVIENDRVAVWDVAKPPTPQSLDAVVVSLSGGASFVPRNTPPKITERSIVIDLKDHSLTPIANTSGYPLAFPRPGSKKILENARVIVWDYTWTPGVATPMHFHDKDVVVVYLEDGDLKSTTPDGKDTVNSYQFGTARFNARDRAHTETLVRGKQHAIITELK